MLREDPLCVFDGKEKMQPRIRLAGADAGGGTCFYHIGNKTQTQEVLVQNIIVANCLDFVRATSTMLATQYIFNVPYDKSVEATLIFFQNYTY